MGRQGMEQQEGREGTAAGPRTRRPAPSSRLGGFPHRVGKRGGTAGRERKGLWGAACNRKGPKDLLHEGPDPTPCPKQQELFPHREGGREGGGAREGTRGGAGRGGRPLTHGAVEVVGRHRPRVPADARARGASASTSRGCGGLGGARTRAGGRSRPGRPPPGRRPGGPPRPPSPGRPWCPRARPPARSSSSPFFRRLVWGSLSGEWSNATPARVLLLVLGGGEKGGSSGSPGRSWLACGAPPTPPPRANPSPPKSASPAEEQGPASPRSGARPVMPRRQRDPSKGGPAPPGLEVGRARRRNRSILPVSRAPRARPQPPTGPGGAAPDRREARVRISSAADLDRPPDWCLLP